MMFGRPLPWYRFANILRVILGMLFLVSGVVKLADLAGFHDDILAYGLVGDPLAGWVAVFIPVMEVVAGALLVLKIVYGGALVVLMGMAGLFFFVISYALYHDLAIACGCFGPFFEKMVSGWSLMFNVFLLGCFIYLLRDFMRECDRSPKMRYHLPKRLFKD